MEKESSRDWMKEMRVSLPGHAALEAMAKKKSEDWDHLLLSEETIEILYPKRSSNKWEVSFLNPSFSARAFTGYLYNNVVGMGNKRKG
jgi:hypothetical protein